MQQLVCFVAERLPQEVAVQRDNCRIAVRFSYGLAFVFAVYCRNSRKARLLVSYSWLAAAARDTARLRQRPR